MNIESSENFTDKELFDLKNNAIKKNKFFKKRQKEAPEFVTSIDKGSYDDIFNSVIKYCNIYLNDDRFVYFIDAYRIPPLDRGVVWDNISVNYKKIISNGLLDLKYDKITNVFTQSYNNIIDGLIFLADRIKAEVELKKVKDWKKKVKYFQRMKDSKADTLEEALQRILFLNQILWQTNHPLMGFGLLDSALDAIYKNDTDITYNAAVDIICDFYGTLHRYYWYKSHALMGDTGQLVIVGRTNIDGSYFCNDLTYAFIDALKRVHLPDPKVLLRVSSRTPEDLLVLASKCIASGIGAPVLANDDKIIPILMADGIKACDACNYTTSACWEPLIGNKCPISNNLTVLNYATSFNNMIKREPLENIKDYETLIERYLFYLRENINAAMRSLKGRRFSYDPLISVFIDGCYEKKKDISQGGAEYYDYGMTTIGIGNVVNALFNIKDLVFDRNIYSMVDIKKMVLTNFAGQDELINLLKEKRVYGKDDAEVIDLTNRLITCVSKKTSTFRNYLGGKVKFGLSSPAYVDAGKVTDATFDGRHKGKPLNVHISCDSPNGYTEIVNFSSQLKMDKNAYNGNVVDIILAPDFIENNIEHFVELLKASIKKGVFELQIGVLNSKQLIEAQKKPELYTNLIVRVWGFSALFIDLPREYQEVVIERAKRSEGRYA